MAHSLKNKAPVKPAPGPHFKKGVALYEAGKLKEACEVYRQALLADPDDFRAWLNLGMTLRQLGHKEAAIVCAQRALESSPANPSILTNYGNCLTDFGRKDEALAAHALAVKARPEDFLARKNYAIALCEFGEFEESLLHLQVAQKIKPQDAGVAWDIALSYLYLGRLQEGWKSFEARWKMPSMKKRACDAPLWQGEDLSGKTILIYEEQGFGDSILCSRYIPMVCARGGKVILECKKPLHRLFSSLQGISRIVEPGGVDIPFDYHIPMMSLPGVFGTGLETIPPPPRLHIPASPPPEAQRLLNFGEGRFKVGIVWSGSVTFASNHKRAVDAARFLPLAGIPGVQLYSLQKGPREKDLADCGGTGLIPELAPYLNDFADTAAVLKQLDLVIMTDSAVAHLAGSIGVPVWNLLHHHPYWLYLSEREDCPWYPSMRLFRQSRPGDWDSVFNNVAAALKKEVARKQNPPSHRVLH
ncbi:MAG: tetratricopeptide repeat protein [Pseudomonadota bacterium]